MRGTGTLLYERGSYEEDYDDGLIIFYLEELFVLSPPPAPPKGGE